MRENKTLIVILITFIALALAWNVLIPPYENLDEIEHAEVVRHIAVTGRLPVHGEAEAAGYHVRQEASQPPLYHILAAGWSCLWRLPTVPHTPDPIPEDIVACGPSGAFYNKATWARDPYQNGLAWTGALRTLYTLRLFSTLLQIATVAGIWTLARRVFRTGPVPLLATALVAFNPQFLLVASGVNNDNAVTPLATWGLVLAYDLWDKGPNTRRVLVFGALSGLAGLSKLSGLALFGLGGLAMLIRTVQRQNQESRVKSQESRVFMRLAGWSALMIALALLIVAPWLLRNQKLYGDPTALAPMLEKVGRRDYPMDLNEVKLMLLSYWGQLPCTFYPRALYWPYLLLMALGFAGLAIGWRRFSQRQKVALSLCAVWFGVIVVAWVRWNTITPATGGRLLFPAIGALALLLAAGMQRRGKGKGGRGKREGGKDMGKLWCYFLVAFLSIWALVTLVTGPGVMFALPPRLHADTAVPNAQDIAFGENLHLRGYEAQVEDAARLSCWLSGRNPCTPMLNVTLYWQATAPIQSNAVMALQLVSPVPGKTDLRLNYNHWPGHGNLPTSAIPVGPVLRDRYHIPLPASDTPTQAWTLYVTFTEPETRARLPVSVGDTPVGDTAQLKLLRVPDRSPIPPWTMHLQATFGDSAVRLEEATVTDDWRVQLWWKSSKLLTEDYTVFVHAYAADGTLLATGDGPPMRGHFPTSLWEPGDLIFDEHHLSLPADVDPAIIAVGVYHPITGDRLSASPANARVENNAALIWEAAP